jgi:predicted DNA-binding transcriptional regulator AlpA
MRQLNVLVQKLDFIINIEELARILSVSRTTLWRFTQKENTEFPVSVQLTPKMKAWLNSEIQNGVNSKRNEEL